MESSLAAETGRDVKLPEQNNTNKKPGGLGGKKILIFIVVIILIIVLIVCCSKSCGGKSNNSSHNQQQNTEAEQILTHYSQPEGYSWADYASGYHTDEWEDNTGVINTSSSGLQMDTVLNGDGTDVATVMVYMCGSDLETEAGAATADIKEMLAAGVGEKVNLIIMTGGARQWRNNFVSNSVNQIYQIQNDQLGRLVEDFGNDAMTKGNTLSKFIGFCDEYFPANRNILILWDHGSGSVGGYGYDEKYESSGSMILPEIKEAIEATDVKFDFIGFDACLMGTVETGLALSKSADYLIASEESEASSGWYYTNWLNRLSSNPAISTVELGKVIADDFVGFVSRYYPGASSTLSVTDLKELANVVPEKLKNFGKNISELLDAGSSSGGSYTSVSKARSKTREFASSSHIDQIDIVDFAKRLGTNEGTALANAVIGAVKYNKVSRDMSGSYGLSIYFPYANASYARMIGKIYKSLGICEEYTECIEKYADTELSGQYVSGGGSPFNSLFGLFGSGSSYGSDYYGSSYSENDYSSLFDLDSLYGSGSSNYSNSYSSNYSSNFFGGYDYSDYDTDSYSSSDISGLLGSFLGGDYFGGRGPSKSMNMDKTAEFIAGNLFDQKQLEARENAAGQPVIAMEEEQWKLVDHILLNMYYDDGEGLIDLGTDNVYEFDDEGSLILENDKTWLSIDGNIIAYYYESTYEGEDGYLIKGYTPVLFRGKRAKLIIAFDSEHPDGYIAGLRMDYKNSGIDTDAQSKILGGLTAEDPEEPEEVSNSLKEGEELTFVADYYDYGGNFVDTYKIGQWKVTLTPEIANMQVEDGKVLAMYSFTDIFNQTYWTQPME